MLPKAPLGHHMGNFRHPIFIGRFMAYKDTVWLFERTGEIIKLTHKSQNVRLN